MNKENLESLMSYLTERKHVEAEEWYEEQKEFNMSSFFCGTATCIAGHAAFLSSKEKTWRGFEKVLDAILEEQGEDAGDIGVVIREMAEEWLDLGEEYRGLFYGPGDVQLAGITPDHARKAIENILRGYSGDMIWNGVFEGEEGKNG